MKTGKSDNQRQGGCLLRWEITRKCLLGCKHCSLRGRRFGKELSYNECLEVLANFRGFLHQNNLAGRIIFTGGDPLLRRDFLDILEAASEYQRNGVIDRIAIDGNASKITPAIAGRLKSAGISYYTFSLDGLENRHDSLRQPGNFQQTISALRCLKEIGIKTKVNFTISRVNAGELGDCLRLLINEGISIFTFNLLKPLGGGVNFKSDLISPLEYRTVLIELIGLLDEIPGISSYFRRSLLACDNLFARAYYELGRLEKYRKITDSPDFSPDDFPQGSIIRIYWGEPVTYDFFTWKYKNWKQEMSRRIREASGKIEKCMPCPVKPHCHKTIRIGYSCDGVLNPLCWAATS